MAGAWVGLHVGRCGIQVADSFLQQMCVEHSIDPSTGRLTDKGSPNAPEAFFSECGSGGYFPRSVAIDLDSAFSWKYCLSRDAATLNTLLKRQNIVTPETGEQGSYGTWPGGRSNGENLWMCGLRQSIRKEVESTGSLKGFYMTFSSAGGTGSGLGSLLLEKLSDDYPKRTIAPFVVVPRVGTDANNVLAYYNSLLTVCSLVKLSSFAVVIDNDALYDICFRNTRMRNPDFNSLNCLIAALMAGATVKSRFNDQKSLGLGELGTVLAPTRPCNLVVGGFSPIECKGERRSECTLVRYPQPERQVESKGRIAVGKTVNTTRLTEAPAASNQIQSNERSAINHTCKQEMAFPDKIFEDQYIAKMQPSSGDAEKMQASFGEQVEEQAPILGKGKLDNIVVQVSPRRVVQHEAAQRQGRTATVTDVLHGVYAPSNILCSIDPLKGHSLKAACIFRGNVTKGMVNEETERWVGSHGDIHEEWRRWMPRKIHSYTCEVPDPRLIASGTFFNHTTSIIQPLETIAKRAQIMFQKKAYIHTYCNETFSESDFDGKFESMREMINEYRKLHIQFEAKMWRKLNLEHKEESIQMVWH